MSFSEQRQQMAAQTTRPILSTYETAYLAADELGDPDTAVERLVDRIRESTCLFAFKTPLRAEFHVAKDHALNCLEIRTIQHRRVKEWISDCLKCMDCVLLVYVRDVLRDAVPSGPRGTVQERDVYNKYEDRGGDFAVVGACFHSVYQKRSELEHIHEIMQDGRRGIRELSCKQKMQIYGFAVQQITKALNIMVPLYKSAFPGCCAGVVTVGAVGGNGRN